MVTDRIEDLAINVVGGIVTYGVLQLILVLSGAPAGRRSTSNFPLTLNEHLFALASLVVLFLMFVDYSFGKLPLAAKFILSVRLLGYATFAAIPAGYAYTYISPTLEMPAYMVLTDFPSAAFAAFFVAILLLMNYLSVQEP